jgi:hypothetical protein
MLCDYEVILVNRIVMPEHRHSFIPGDLHRREGVDASPPEVRGRRVAQIVRDSLSRPCLLADPAEDFSNRFDPLPSPCEHMSQASPLSVQANWQALQDLSQLAPNGNVPGLFGFRVGPPQPDEASLEVHPFPGQTQNFCLAQASVVSTPKHRPEILWRDIQHTLKLFRGQDAIGNVLIVEEGDCTDRVLAEPTTFQLTKPLRATLNMGLRQASSRLSVAGVGWGP